MTAEEKAEHERWEATLPEGEDDMTPEQRAELAAIVAQYEAGTLPFSVLARQASAPTCSTLSSRNDGARGEVLG